MISLFLTSAMPPAPVGEKLAASVARALAAAPRPRWIRVRARFALADPWSLLDVAATGATPFCAFSDGEGCFVSLGESASWSFGGAARWREAAARFDELERGLAVVDAGGAGEDHAARAPLAVAGFAFDPGSPPVSSPWRRWPAARLLVPEVLVWQDAPLVAAGLSELAVTLPVAAGADPARIARQVAESWDRLHLVVARAAAEVATVADVHRGLRDGLVASAAAEVATARGGAPRVARVESEQEWGRRVAAARAAIRRGVLDKVVLARVAELGAPTAAGFDAAATLHRLRAAQRRSVTFAVSPGCGEVFLGATPERLLVLARGRVETHAVAGTAPRGADARGDAELARALLASPKDRAEHALVVEHLRARLAPECGALEVDREPRVIALPHVQHLETRVGGRLRRSAGALRLGVRLHPTPAVGGWPVEAASAWLREHEPLERGWYAGVVGYLTGGGDGVLAVAIRSALLQGGTARVYAGAGIVSDSDAAAEWRETELKLATMRDALLATRDHP